VLGTWRELDPAGHIEDPALEVPLPIEAMVHAAKADDAVARWADLLNARHRGTSDRLESGRIPIGFAFQMRGQIYPDGSRCNRSVSRDRHSMISLLLASDRSVSTR
jgi:hypothetical protein